jgi:hypothetical protein
MEKVLAYSRIGKKAQTRPCSQQQSVDTIPANVPYKPELSMTPSESSGTTKPTQLIITTALMAFAVIAALVGAIWLWSTLPHPLTGSVLLLGCSSVLLWFYWQGYGAARWTVLVLSVLLIIDALNVLFRLPLLAPFSAEPDLTFGKAKYVIQLCICTYVVGWLVTRNAARYFSADARRERNSLLVARSR